MPGEDTRMPGEDTRMPGEATRMPGEATWMPGQDTRMPRHDTQQATPRVHGRHVQWRKRCGKNNTNTYLLYYL